MSELSLSLTDGSGVKPAGPGSVSRQAGGAASMVQRGTEGQRCGRMRWLVWEGDTAKKSQGPGETVLVKGFTVGLLWATSAFQNTEYHRALGNK